MTNKIIKFFTAGSVDGGKSTLIGRMLYDTNALYEDQIAEIKKLNNGKIDYSLFVEGLESELRQKITIDVAYRYFSYQGNKFIIADSPGHEQYTKNMAVAAANSDIAVILIDAKEGVKTQTIRHSHIANLFGIKKFVIVINKMDLVDYSQERFDYLAGDYLSKIKSLKIDDIFFIPIIASDGDNIATKSDRIKWYQGDHLLDYLKKINLEEDRPKSFGFVVQNVFKYENQRLYQGRIISGKVKIGDEIHIYPSNKNAKIKNIIHSSLSVNEAHNGDSITLILDREIDIDRGSFFSNPNNKPNFNKTLNADIIWFGSSEFNLKNPPELLIKFNHNQILARINKINQIVNIDDSSVSKNLIIEQNQIANVSIDFAKSVAFDYFKNNKFSGSFLLIDKNTNETLASGLIEDPKISKKNSLLNPLLLFLKIKTKQ